MNSEPSFESICEDLQSEIHLCLASSSEEPEIFELQTLQRTIKRIREDPFVLTEASTELPLARSTTAARHPDFHQKYETFLRRCCNVGNPEATFCVGISQYFDPNSDLRQQEEGLHLLDRASKMGVERAIQMYGLIMICLGGEKKEKGFQILSHISMPLTTTTVTEMESCWADNRRQLSPRGELVMEQLRLLYVRENCICDGFTSRWFAKDSWPGPNRFSRFEGKPTYIACKVCLWHEVLRIFLDF